MPPKVSAEERFSHLTRETYQPVEIAFMMAVEVHTIRRYFRQDSKTREGEKLLIATKINSSYFVSRQDLIKFFKEIYGET
jgi:hypothetical protein